MLHRPEAVVLDASLRMPLHAPRSIAALPARVLVLVAAALMACSEQEAPERTAPTAVSAPREPLSRPVELVGLGWIAPARQLWPPLRRDLRPADPGLALGFGAALASELGLPLSAAELFDEDAPTRFGLVRAESGELDVVLAFACRSTDQLLVLASAGSNARFDRASEAGLEWLRPRGRSPGSASAMAVARDHVLIATRPRALHRAGAYLGDPGSSVEPTDGSALLEVELPADELGRLVSRAQVARLGDLGWLAGALSARTHQTARSEATRVRVHERAGIWRATLELRHLEGAQGSGSGAPLGERLLELPAELALALVFRDPEPSRRASATSARSWIDGLSRERGLARPSNLEQLEVLAEARGETTWIGLEPSPVGPLVYGAASLADVELAQRALDALFAGPKRSTQGRVSRPDATPTPGLLLRKTVIERVGEVYQLRLRSSAQPSTPTSVLARIEGRELLLGAGHDAEAALERVRLRVGPRLAEVDAVRASVLALPSGVDALGLVDLEAMGAESLARGSRPAGAPLLFAFVRGAAHPVVEAAVDPSVLRSLVARLRR